MCQEARLAAGELGPSLPLGTTRFHRFDRVLFMRNRSYYGLTNGELGTVTAINPVTLTLTVKLDDTKKSVAVPLREYQDLALGYAMTTHKSQSATVSKCMVLGSSRTTKELSFVQLSRHKKDTSLYLTEGQAGEDLSSIARAMERSERRKMAHELKAELEQSR
jgi:ATP-dependent exoDNAse (exonuclease V) alpha subunit